MIWAQAVLPKQIQTILITIHLACVLEDEDTEEEVLIKDAETQDAETLPLYNFNHLKQASVKLDSHRLIFWGIP